MIPLQKLCVSVIAENFEKLLLAFEDPNNEIPKRGLQFLQRHYSFELADELYILKTLKDEFLELLLNEHLKILDVNWLNKSRFKNSVENILCRLPNLTKIYRAKLTDEILEKLTKHCPKLVEINSSYAAPLITDDGIKYLCKNEKGDVPCPELKKLYFVPNRVTNEGLMCVIQNLPSLEKIKYCNVPRILYSFYKDDLPNLENVSNCNLTNLNFNVNSKLPYYTDILKICLKVCPKLKSMKCPITEQNQLNFFNCIYLKKLFLYGESKPQIDVNNFLKINGCNLVSLELWECTLSINILATSCPKLKRLHLGDCNFSGDFHDTKTYFHNLADCYFSETSFDATTNEGLSLLLSCSPKLERLTFTVSKFAPKKESGNIQWPQCNLKYVTIFGCYVKVEIVKDILSNCLFLNVLNLGRWNDNPSSVLKELLEYAARLHHKPKIEFD